MARHREQKRWLKELEKGCGKFKEYDVRHGSEKNYRFMEEAGMAVYVKYNRFHME